MTITTLGAPAIAGPIIDFSPWPVLCALPLHERSVATITFPAVYPVGGVTILHTDVGLSQHIHHADAAAIETPIETVTRVSARAISGCARVQAFSDSGEVPYASDLSAVTAQVTFYGADTYTTQEITHQ